jgi:hypothetical protein
LLLGQDDQIFKVMRLWVVDAFQHQHDLNCLLDGLLCVKSDWAVIHLWIGGELLSSRQVDRREPSE